MEDDIGSEGDVASEDDSPRDTLARQMAIAGQGPILSVPQQIKSKVTDVNANTPSSPADVSIMEADSAFETTTNTVMTKRDLAAAETQTEVASYNDADV